MTDNNGKALREAKARLDDTVVLTNTEGRLIRALAALVEAVEAAPVATVQMLGNLILSDVDNDCLKLIGQRVRVLAVGEESND